MNDKEDSIFSSLWFLRIISLVLAIFLFVYVNGGKNGQFRQNSDSNQSVMSNKSESIKMPLQLRMNSRKYVVTGYPQYVKVKVVGPGALVTSTANTQNFKVYADLTDLKTGHHTVKLKTSGLNSELKAKVTPKEINVNIQPRRTITSKVEVRLSNRNLDGQYQVGRPTPSMSTVQVTGAKNQVRKVARVIAYVDVPKDSTHDIHRQVTLQAVDKKGRAVDVVVVPNTITVTVPIIGGGEPGDDNNSSSADNSSSGSSASSSSSTRDQGNQSNNATATSNSDKRNY